MVEVRPHPEGALLTVKASPAARRNAVTGHHDGALRISVTAAPEKGRANAAIAKLLAKALGVRTSEVQIVSGDTYKRKVFLVRGFSPEELCQKVAALVEKSS